MNGRAGAHEPSARNPAALVVGFFRGKPRAHRSTTRETDEMTQPRPLLDQDDDADLPDDLIESIGETPDDEDDLGDETQFDEEFETEEGLEQESFIEPRPERDEDID
jgi:hypothetical protein